MTEFIAVETERFIGHDCPPILQQFDDRGNHRLIVHGHEYDPAGYAFIATAPTPYGTFAGTTEYYGETLPRVFEIKSLRKL